MRILATSFFAITLMAAGACERGGNSGGTGVTFPPDVGSDAGPGEVTPPNDDGTVPDNNTPNDDGPVDVPPTAGAGTVKALQLASEEVACIDGFNNLAPASLKGVVVTTPKYDAYTPSDGTGEALDGYFVADVDGGDWSGVQVVVPRTEATDWQIGDTLDLDGEVVEFYCFTQLSVTSHAVVGTAAVPAPVIVSAADAAQEKYEGMLVTAQGVTVKGTGGGGSYTTDQTDPALNVAPAFDFFLSLELNESYDITAVLAYSFSAYTLWPRTEGDVVWIEGGGGGDTDGGGTPSGDPNTTINGMQSGADSTTCMPNDNITVPGEVIFDGIVIVEQFSVTSSGSLVAWIVSDGSQDPYSAVMVMFWASDGPPTLALGDEVRVTGAHLEYYCLTEIQATSIEVLGTGAAVPAPVPLDDATYLADPEQWEGMVIELSNQSVADNAAWNMAEMYYATLTSGILMDNSIIGPDNWATAPDNGTTWTTLRGVVRHSWNALRVSPRSMDDLIP